MNHPRARTTIPLIAVVAILSLSLTACEAETDPPAYDEEPVRQTADSPVPQSEKVVEIDMTEFAFEPSEITVPAGEQVTLRFENLGSLTHEFMAGSTLTENVNGFKEGLFSGVDVHFRKNGEEIKEGAHTDAMTADSTAADSAEGMKEDEHHGKMVHLEPGDVASMTFTLPESKAGEYAFACFESTGDTKHVKRGMRGTLIVRAPNQAG